MAPSREIDSFECTACGATLETWDTAWVPTYRLIAAPAIGIAAPATGIAQPATGITAPAIKPEEPADPLAQSGKAIAPDRS
jgi:hypothetical protein